MAEERSELIVRLCQNDADAMKEIFNLYYRRVLGFARRYVDEADVEDVVQESFFHVFSKVENIHEISSFEKYLFRATKNRCINWLRRKYRVKNLLELVCYSASLWNQEDDHPGFAGLDLLMEELPEEAREYIRLFYVQKHSRSEIAALMKESSSSVYRKISGSRAMLLQKADELGLKVTFQGRHELIVEEQKS